MKTPNNTLNLSDGSGARGNLRVADGPYALSGSRVIPTKVVGRKNSSLLQSQE